MNNNPEMAKKPEVVQPPPFKIVEEKAPQKTSAIISHAIKTFVSQGRLNLSGIMGIFCSLSVILYTHSGAHGLGTILGGTFSVALLCFPLNRLFSAAKVVIGKLFVEPKFDYPKIIDTIINASQTHRNHPRVSLELIPKNVHPFFREGMQMLVEFGFNPVDLDKILQSSIDGKKKRDADNIKVWQTLSRFPLAFGFLSATTILIHFFQTMNAPGSAERLGATLAMALASIFYGLIITNFIFIPTSEKLSELATEEHTMRLLIKEGILLMQKKLHPLFISEYLKAYLGTKKGGLSVMSEDIAKPGKKAA